MGIKKQYLKTKPVCKTTFILEKDAVNSAKNVFLVGEFNDWDPQATPLKKSKTGEFKVTIELESGKEYQFRYLVDGSVWQNDWNADKYIAGPFGDDNSVVIL